MLYINSNGVGLLLVDGTNPILEDNNIYNKSLSSTTVVQITSSQKMAISVLSTLSEWNIAKTFNGKSVTFGGGYSGNGVLSIKSNRTDGVYVFWTAEII